MAGADDSFRRYHALDAVRAVMMLLGLVIHAAVSYIKEPLPVSVWPYKDPQTATALDALTFFIHLFRMPVFFVVAGFFAALLLQRSGAWALLKNRIMRVAVPLIVFWIVTYPASKAAVTYAEGQLAGRHDWAAMTSGAFLADGSLLHLWFLYHLLFFYACTVVVAPLLARAPAPWQRRVDALVGRVATTVAGALLLSSVTALTLLPMTKPALDTALGLRPPLRVLVAYAVFYVFGFLLFRRRDLIQRFGAGWRLPLAGGGAASVGYLVTTVAKPIADPWLYHVTACVLAGLSIWLLIFGIVGAFVTYLDRPHPVVRYLADASYWMYLIHLPLTLWLAAALASSPLPAAAKFLIVVSTTTVVTVVSYHYLVRATAIGALLNGRRYARALPEPEPGSTLSASSSTVWTPRPTVESCRRSAETPLSWVECSDERVVPHAARGARVVGRPQRAGLDRGLRRHAGTFVLLLVGGHAPG